MWCYYVPDGRWVVTDTEDKDANKNAHGRGRAGSSTTWNIVESGCERCNGIPTSSQGHQHLKPLFCKETQDVAVALQVDSKRFYVARIDGVEYQAVGVTPTFGSLS